MAEDKKIKIKINGKEHKKTIEEIEQLFMESQAENIQLNQKIKQLESVVAGLKYFFTKA